MATINKSILGKVSGALGDVTFRQRNGKNYVAVRPGSFVPGNDPASVARREKFSLANRLSKYIYSIPELKENWAEHTPPGASTFNYIMRINYPLISFNELSGLVMLNPALGFNAPNPIVTLNPPEFKVNLDAIGNTAGIDAEVETTLKLFSVIYLTNSSDSLVSKNSFLTFASELKPTDLVSPLEFTFKLSDVDSQMLAIYQNKQSLFTLASLNAEGKIVHYSNTFTG